MDWGEFRCYWCHKKWSRTTARVVYRSMDDDPLVIAGYACGHCGTVFLIQHPESD